MQRTMFSFCMYSGDGYSEDYRITPCSESQETSQTSPESGVSLTDKATQRIVCIYANVYSSTTSYSAFQTLTMSRAPLSRQRRPADSSTVSTAPSDLLS